VIIFRVKKVVGNGDFQYGCALAPPASLGEHDRQTVFGEFQAKISPLVAAIFRNFQEMKHQTGGL